MSFLPDAPVLIVGAGPTGLMLAIELRRRGVAANLVEKHALPLPWDRATVVQPRAAEAFAQLGLGEAFRAEGHATRGITFFGFGEALPHLSLAAPDTAWPFQLMIPEHRTERILTAELERVGGRVHRGITFLGLDQDEDRVRLRLADAEGTVHRLERAWVVGTDGMHSRVRTALGLGYEGKDYPLPWAVVDGRVEGWGHPRDRGAVQFELPGVIPIPLPEGRWRIYFRPPPEGRDPLAAVARGLARISPGARLVAPDRPAVFNTHFRIAERYREGRVLLAGDAAHACSPIQGHGMCVGIGDAQNLGWRLALVAEGIAEPALLDAYEQERRPVAAWVGDAGDEAEKRGRAADEASGRPLLEELRIRLSSPQFRLMAAWAGSELAFSYRGVDENGTCLLGPRTGRLRPGDRMPDLEGLQDAEGGPLRLHELTRGETGHVLLLLDDQIQEADLAAAAAGWPAARRDRLAVYGVAARGAGPRVARDPEGRLRARTGLGAGGRILLRPDGHIALLGGGSEKDGYGDAAEMRRYTTERLRLGRTG